MFEDDEENKIDPYRKVIEIRAGKKKITFDSNHMPIAKCEEICQLYALEKGKMLHPSMVKYPRDPGESLKDYDKRLAKEKEKKKAEAPSDFGARQDGENEKDWQSRIFADAYSSKPAALEMGRAIINGAQTIVYGESGNAQELTEEEFKLLKLRPMMTFVKELLTEAGQFYAPEFDLEIPKS